MFCIEKQGLNLSGKIKIDAGLLIIEQGCAIITIEQSKYARENFWNCHVSWIKRKNANKE